jgi:hypothetical protein
VEARSQPRKNQLRAPLVFLPSAARTRRHDAAFEKEHPRNKAGEFKGTGGAGAAAQVGADGAATAKIARESLTITNTNVTRDDALKELAALAGKPLENEETGIMAEINREQRGKIVSTAALEKSQANGFTAGQHNAAAARMETLWKHATLLEKRPDNNGDPNIASIKRFAAPVIFEGETAAAYITAKESVRHGHRIYSLELMEIKKLRAKGGEAGNSASIAAPGGLKPRHEDGTLENSASDTTPEASTDIERRLLEKINTKNTPEKTNAAPIIFRPPPLVFRPASPAFAAPAFRANSSPAPAPAPGPGGTRYFTARINTLGAGAGKGRAFTSRFIEPGLISYQDQNAGVELLRKATIEKALGSMIGRPVIIEHQALTPENRAALEKGVVEGTGYDAASGWFFCTGKLTSGDAVRLVRDGLSVSCAFEVNASVPSNGKKWHAMDYDRELAGITFTHLAIVANPRFEGATIRLNSKRPLTITPNPGSACGVKLNSKPPRKNKTPAMLKWIKKKLGAGQTDEAGDIAPDAVVRVNSKHEARVADLIAAYKRLNEAPPEKDGDKKETELSDETEFEVEGKKVTARELIAAYKKVNGIEDENPAADGTDDDAAADDAAAADDDLENDDEGAAAKKEKAEDGNVVEKKNRKKTNSLSFRSPENFKILARARANAGAPARPFNRPQTVEDKLARARQLYGTPGKN